MESFLLFVSMSLVVFIGPVLLVVFIGPVRTLFLATTVESKGPKVKARV